MTITKASGANIAIGGYDAGNVLPALYTNTTGNNNIAIGTGALALNTTASDNTAVGYQAGYGNTTATGVTVVGSLAGRSNTTGSSVTGIGHYTLYSNTTGASVTAVGRSALQSNTTGSGNTAIGRDSLLLNTTANNNTAIGYQSGYSNTTGANNVFLGQYAGYSTSSGGNNTFVGYAAGHNTAGGTGTTNICVGYNSGSTLTSGSKNVIIGSYTGGSAPISATGNNYIVLSDGDGNVRQVIDSSGNVGIGTVSPNTLLSVAHVASAGTSIGIQHSSNNAQLLRMGWNDSADYTFINTSNGSRPLVLQNTGGNVVINPDNNGTGAKLDIYGGGLSTLGAIRIGDGTLGAGHTNYWDIGRDNGVTGDFTFALNATQKFRITTAGALAFGTSSTNYGSSGQILQSNGNASPSWVTQPVKMWVYFQGGNGNTAGVILGSFNVSSITVNGTGDYTINFTTATANANYAVNGTVQFDSGGSTSSAGGFNIARTTGVQTTTSCRVCTFSTYLTSYQDFQYVSASVLGA